MTDRIEELGRAKEGVLVTYRVAFDDGTTSVIKPSERAIAFEWQTRTYLGKISEINPELQARACTARPLPRLRVRA